MSSRSRQRARIDVLALVLVVIIAGMLAHRALAARPVAPTTVATVDLERLFEGLQMRGQADAGLQAMAEQLDQDGQRLREEIESIRADAEILKPGSETYNQAMETLSLKVLEYEAFMEFGRRKIDVEKALSLKRIYLNIKESVHAMAQSSGLDIVFVDDSIAGLESGSESEVMRQISARRILYANTAIDITDDLMQMMNAG